VSLIEPCGAKHYDLEFGRGNCEVSCARSAEDETILICRTGISWVIKLSTKYK